MSGEMGDRRKLEKRMEREGRLPPGQALTRKLPVLHYGPVPVFDPDRWDFRIWGELEQEVCWTWEEFNRLLKTEIHMDIHCVTRWSKFDTSWKGISVRMLVERGIIQPKPEARYVMQHCEYGYTANLPLDVVMGENFLLATHYQGEPLAPEHGRPLRGVVGHIPGQKDIKSVYFWKGGKWLRGLEFMAEDRLGFWEQAGYHNEADIWKEQRRTR